MLSIQSPPMETDFDDRKKGANLRQDRVVV